MEFLNNFIDWVKTSFDTFFKVINSVFIELITFFKYLGIVIKNTGIMIDSLPTFLKVFGTVTIAIAILYIVLGRQTGASHSD